MPLTFESFLSSAGLLIRVALFLWAFWYVFILVMGLYRASLAGRLEGSTKVLAFPAVLVGIIMDVFANLTIAVVIFRDLPSEWLVTSRLQRYAAGSDGWRKTRAEWICTNLLDPYDPSGDHC